MNGNEDSKMTMYETKNFRAAMIEHPAGDLIRIESTGRLFSLVLDRTDCREIRDILDHLEPMLQVKDKKE